MSRAVLLGQYGRVNSDRYHDLADGLALAVTEPDSAATAKLMTFLGGLTGPGWLRVDESARRYYAGPRLHSALAGWQPCPGAAVPPPWAVAASMAQNGRVRETAVSALAGIAGPVASAALAVRVADWVPEVSAAASAALASRTGPKDAAAAIPVLLALGERQRGREAAARYLACIATGPEETLRVLAGPGDRGRRTWALGALLDRGRLTAEELTARAVGDPDPVTALWCARRLAGPGGELEPGAVGRLLGSARPGVRAFAAGKAGADVLTHSVLHGLLLDRSGAVRSVARWRWKQQYGNPRPVYQAVLAGTSLPRAVAAALQGLDDDHDDALPAAAVPFLSDPSPAVRRAAVLAVARHTPDDDTVSFLVPLLLDPSAKVAATALRYVRGKHLPPSVLANLDAAGTGRARRAALAIRQHLGTWDRVLADLSALAGPDPDLADTARADLLAWLQHDAVTTYTMPAPVQAERIAGLLNASGISQAQRRRIAFTAGIPTSASRD